MPKSSPKPLTKTKCVCCNAPIRKTKSHLVFDEYGKFRRIQFLLAECLSKQVVEVPGGQQSICIECLNQLDQNYAFKLKCMRQNEEPPIDEESEEDSDQSAEEEVMEVEQSSVGVETDDNNVMPLPNTLKMEHIETDNIEYKVIGNRSPLLEILDDDGSLNDHKGSVCELIIGVEDSAAITEDSQQSNENLELEAIETFVIEEDDEQDAENKSQNLDPLNEKQESQDVIDLVFTDVSEYVCSLNGEIDDDINHADSPTIATSFIESLTVHSVKQIIRKGIPTHCLKIPPKPQFEDTRKNVPSRSEVLNKVNGDDDEEDLSTDDDFFVPTLKIEQIEMKISKEMEPVDLDEYVRAIASVSFCEFSSFVGQPFCKVLNILFL